MATLDTPDQIRAFQLLAVRAAIRLQAKGFRHSSGKNIKAMWARHYGLSARAQPEAVIEKLEAELKVLKGRIENVQGRTMALGV